MAKEKTKPEEEIDVNSLVDDIDNSNPPETTEDIENDGDDLKETPQEEKPNITTVSNLQPQRTKPGYPQELKNSRGFGYTPSK